MPLITLAVVQIEYLVSLQRILKVPVGNCNITTQIFRPGVLAEWPDSPASPPSYQRHTPCTPQSTRSWQERLEHYIIPFGKEPFYLENTYTIGYYYVWKQ